MPVGFSLGTPMGRLAPEDVGAPDYVKALSAGTKMGNEPAQLSATLLGTHLTNALNRVKAQYAPAQAQAELAHAQALTEKAKRGPAPVLNNLEKAQAGYERAVHQFGEKSEQARDAKAYAQRIAQGSQGLQLTTDPTTGALTSLSFGGSSRGGPQSALTTDAEGNQVVVSKPTTAQATAQQKSSLSEIGRGTIAERAEMPYIGSGSNAKIIEDRLNYQKGDKAAGERLVRAAVAEMIAPEYAGFQLASQGISATIPALNHQFETIKQGWPAAANLVVENLPPELQKEAKKQHAALLKEIKQAKEQHASRGYPIKVGKNATTNRLKYNPVSGRLE